MGKRCGYDHRNIALSNCGHSAVVLPIRFHVHDGNVVLTGQEDRFLVGSSVVYGVDAMAGGLVMTGVGLEVPRQQNRGKHGGGQAGA